MSKLLIFDADSPIFTVAWRFRKKKTGNLVKLNINKFISDVLRNCNPDDYIGFYGAKDEDNLKPNFRYAVDPKYKANRPPTPDFVVKWGPTIRTEYKDKWGFIPIDGMEADDAVAIAVKKYRDQYDEIIVATFDKDLKQIPNITFYNMKTHKSEHISKFDAYKNFYTQMLMGDVGDNIPGLKGIGKGTAPKILKDCDSIYGLFRTTVTKYKEIENETKIKALSVIAAEIKAELEDVEIDSTDSIYKGLTGVKLARKIRINTKHIVEESIETIMPGGWKSYFHKQYSLLRMLVNENDAFTVPDVIINPVKRDEDEEEISIKKATDAILTETVDDFLTI